MTTLEGLLDEFSCERAIYDEQATNVLQDNEHLTLVLLANGSKQWRITLRDQNGTSTVRFLGSYPAMTLAGAREATLLELNQIHSTIAPPLPEQKEKNTIEPTPSSGNVAQEAQDLFAPLTPKAVKTPEVRTQKTSPSPKKNTPTKASLNNPKTSTKKTVEAPPPKVVKHTFSNTVRRWLKANQERWKENRFQQIEKIAVTILSPQLKPYDFKELSPSFLKDCLENLANTQGKMVAREALLILKGVIEYAIEKNYITHSPLESIQNQLSFTEVAKSTTAKTTTAASVKTRVQALKQKPEPQNKTAKTTLVTTNNKVVAPLAEPVTSDAPPPIEKPTLSNPIDLATETNAHTPLNKTDASVTIAAESTVAITPPLSVPPAPAPLPIPQPTAVSIPLEDITLGYLLKKQIKSLLQHLNLRGMLGYIIVAAISSWLAMWLVQQEKELLLIKLDVTEKKLEVLESNQKHTQDTEQKLKTALSELQELANECRVDLKKAIKNTKKD